MILEADNDFFKSVAKGVFDSFEVSAVNVIECMRCFDDECVMVSLFNGELNCGGDDVVKYTNSPSVTNGA